MQVKMNSHMLEDAQMASVMHQLLDLMRTGEDVADIYEEPETGCWLATPTQLT